MPIVERQYRHVQVELMESLVKMEELRLVQQMLVLVSANQDSVVTIAKQVLLPLVWLTNTF